MNVCLGLVWFMVLNATLNNISVISWRSVLLVKETGVPEENHQPVASHWQTLSHNVSSTPCLSGIRTHNVSGDKHWLHGSCITNYHMIMTTTPLVYKGNLGMRWLIETESLSVYIFVQLPLCIPGSLKSLIPFKLSCSSCIFSL